MLVKGFKSRRDSRTLTYAQLLPISICVCLSLAIVDRVSAAATSRSVGVNRTVPTVTAPSVLDFSLRPADDEFLRTGLFDEPWRQWRQQRRMRTAIWHKLC